MPDFSSRRTTMVDTQVRPADVTRFPIIEAMLTVPRESFVPDDAAAVAYADRDVPLWPGRVVLAPRSLSKMLDALALQPEDVVLDLGCGMGYSTAVLARMVSAVVAVEDSDERAETAQRLLSEQGLDNAAVMAGPLTDGSAGSGPYDAIILQGAISVWPDALTAQLADGGRAIAIWHDQGNSVVRLGRRHGDAMIWRDEFHAAAPGLPGFEARKDFAL